MTGKNWAGNYEYHAARLHQPTTVEQIQELVRDSRKVKALGSRHSFNHIADTDTDHIALSNLNHIIEINAKISTVTVESGVRYGDLCHHLHQKGFALHNLASLPHISVAGACATATHGSGVNNRSLASAVSAIEFVAANGELVRLSRANDGGKFAGAVVNLGALGVVTRITLELLPTFDMRQYVYLKLPFAQLHDHFDEIMSSAYSVSLFTDWQSDDINHVWQKQKLGLNHSPDTSSKLFGATLATQPYHPLAGHPPDACTEQMGIPGAWYDRLAHFRMDFTPSSGEELQSEYFVPLEYAVDALHAIKQIRDHITPHLYISEIRTIASDDLWMSPFYEQASVGIHFTWKPHWDSVRQVLPLIEAQLDPFNPRPHWGKLFTMPAEKIQARCQKLNDFRQLAAQYDPDGKFRNAFLEEYIF